MKREAQRKQESLGQRKMRLLLLLRLTPLLVSYLPAQFSPLWFFAATAPHADQADLQPQGLGNAGPGRGQLFPTPVLAVSSAFLTLPGWPKERWAEPVTPEVPQPPRGWGSCCRCRCRGRGALALLILKHLSFEPCALSLPPPELLSPIHHRRHVPLFGEGGAHWDMCSLPPPLRRGQLLLLLLPPCVQQMGG